MSIFIPLLLLLNLVFTIDNSSENQAQFYKNTYGLIVGIDNYPNLGFNMQLDYGVSDAKAIYKLISENYTFSSFIQLYNNEATKYNIEKAINTYRNTDPDDAIFIFFAGHGYTENTPDGDLGYIIPYDGSIESIEMYRNISMNEIKDFLKPIKAKHIFLVIDACYSGSLLTTRGLSINNNKDYHYLKEISNSRVRQVLTAGGKNQQVLDGGPNGHSVFAGYFIKHLQTKNKYITASEIGSILPKEVFTVANERGHIQVPQFGNLTGEGDFIFQKISSTSTIFKKTNLEQNIASLDVNINNSALPSSKPNLANHKNFINFSIMSQPSRASVYINNNLAGITPLIKKLEYGSHQISFYKDNYIDKIISISLNSESDSKLIETLERKTGNLSITSSPKSGRLYLNNELKGETPLSLDSLPTGNYIVEIKGNDFKSQLIKAAVTFNENNNINIPTYLKKDINKELKDIKFKRNLSLYTGLILNISALYLYNQESNSTPIILFSSGMISLGYYGYFHVKFNKFINAWNLQIIN